MQSALDSVISLWDQQHTDPAGNAAKSASFLTASDPVVRAWAALTIAAYDLRFGDLEHAAQLLETARDQLGDPRNAQEERCLWLTDAAWGYLLLRRGQTSLALKHISALQLTSSPYVQPSDWCMLHTTLHFIYKRQGEFETSLRQIYVALELVEKHALRGMDPLVRLNLAALFMRIEDWAGAAEQLNRADKMAANMVNHALTQRIRINRAITAQHVGDLAGARALTRECLTYRDLDQGSVIELWINAVHVSLALKDHAAAVDALQNATLYAERPGHSRFTTAIAYAQAQVHIAAERFKEAEETSLQALALALADDELRLSMRPAILRALAQAQAGLGDHKAAYATLALHHEAHNEFVAYRIKNTKLTLAAQAETRRLTIERDQARKLQQLAEAHAAQLRQQLSAIDPLQLQTSHK